MTVHSNSKHIVIGIPLNTKPYIIAGANMSGTVRYNVGNLEVFDGSRWQILYTEVLPIELSLETESLLDWISIQRRNESEIAELSKTKPAIAIAMENVKRAKAQLEATVILSKEHTI